MKHVHILITIRKPEMVDAALLVFKTIRIGFPTATIHVWGNELTHEYTQIFSKLGVFFNLPTTCHDEWIESLVNNCYEPFWICDSDIVFFDKVEDWIFNTSFAGRYQKTYREPWTNTQYVERLHTCLQWFNPSLLRGEMLRWSRQNIPDVFRTANVPFIRQHFIPLRGIVYLYDTTAGLWHTCSGTAFSKKQDKAFEHLHCGTYSDEVSKCPKLNNLQTSHKLIFKQQSLAKGLKEKQDKFYEEQSTTQ